MYKMWRQDPGNMTLKQRYQSYAEVLEKIILNAKRNYDIAEVEKASTNNKNLWNYIKEKIKQLFLGTLMYNNNNNCLQFNQIFAQR